MSLKRTTRTRRSTLWVVMAVVTSVGVLMSAAAEAQPDPRQMSGLPLPDPELPDGTITVRVIRGQITNNVPGLLVELRQGDTVETALTDDEGRATFLTLNPGSQVQASVEMDGERIQSQPFPVPGRGGIRVMLVGADPDMPVVPARPGTVSFGGESWIQVELIEESVEVYYLFDVFNPSNAPVTPDVPISFDVPSGAQGTTVLQGSSPRTLVDGRRVELPGPFDPGTTPFRVAYILPYTDESLVISQSFPVDLDSLLVSVERWGGMNFVASQVERRMELPASEGRGTPYILGAGPRIPAGQTLAIELVGLPHRSKVPSNIALTIAIGVLAIGLWRALGQPEASSASKRRKELEARKEKLFADLVKNERQHRVGKIGPTKYASRRQEAMKSLERVYRELDEQLTSVLLSPVSPPDSQVASHSRTVG